MLCPRCSYGGEAHHGRCPRCGNVMEVFTGDTITDRYSGPLRPTPMTASRVEALMRGDVVHGHYRLIEYIALPKNQQRHGMAWIALDTEGFRNRMIVRQVRLPGSEDPPRLFQAIVTRMRILAEHGGFPPVVDSFFERGHYYLVQQAPSGESLASLMRKQGGALDERNVAEYGRQLCEILALLSQHQPPLVHGGISPDTIIINSNTLRVSLSLMPLFPPDTFQRNNDIQRYTAPEQVRGEILPSSDLYSVAAVLHHAVTGFASDERVAHFYPPVRRLNPLVSAEMEAILGRELRLSVRQRYPGPQEMQRAFNNLLASYPVISATPVSQLLTSGPLGSKGLASPLDPKGPASPFEDNTSKQNRVSRNVLYIISPCIFMLLVLLLTALNTTNDAEKQHIR